jgi:hypothetical protein
LNSFGGVDNRIHPQDQAEFVVHLQPVSLHAVLDAGSEPAVLFAVCGFRRRSGDPIAAEEAESVLGGKCAHRVIQERTLQTGQRGETGEQQVGGELSLIDDPVHGVAPKQFVKQGIDLRAQRLRVFAQLS